HGQQDDSHEDPNRKEALMKPTIGEPGAEHTEEDEMRTSDAPTTIKDREIKQVERANATTATPVVFVHGLWLLPSSWANWADLFNQAGYPPLTPDWPHDPP